MLAVSLVRTHSVEQLAKLVEASLLGRESSFGWLSGPFLQVQMHALQTAVLLWSAGFDSNGQDAKVNPPLGQLGDGAECRWCTERRPAIVHDLPRHTVLAEDSFVASLCLEPVGTQKCIDC